MKSKTTKFAAAAVIITAVLIGVSIDGVAIGQIIEAMNEQQWVHTTYHFVSQNALPPETTKLDGAQYWECIKPFKGITIQRNGTISFLEGNTIKKYDPNNNTITIIPVHSTFEDKNNLVDVWLAAISELEKEGAEIKYSNCKYNDVPAKTVEVDCSNVDLGPEIIQQEITIIVDAKTHLARKFTLYREASDDIFITIEMLIDYPENGPVDIYEAGAPRDALIIQKIPEEN